MKAKIWGSCGSLPSPVSTDSIRRKMVRALWGARDQHFTSEADVERYLDDLPHSAQGTYKANTSCVQILSKSEDYIFCDAGTGLRDFALSLAPDAPAATYHIFISHLHWDHIQGFPFFAPAYKAGNRIIFHGFHPEIEASIRDQMKAPCFPCRSRPCRQTSSLTSARGEAFQIDGVEVRTIKQQHPGVSWGFRFEEDGASIVYSSDSEHGPEAREPGYAFIEFFRDADVLIFDGQYTFEEAANEKRELGGTPTTSPASSWPPAQASISSSSSTTSPHTRTR